jgi:GNAT superfamily N-acetyltransferase
VLLVAPERATGVLLDGLADLPAFSPDADDQAPYDAVLGYVDAIEAACIRLPVPRDAIRPDGTLADPAFRAGAPVGAANRRRADRRHPQRTGEVPMTHHTERPPLFCDVALASRIERAEADLIARSSDAARHRRRDSTGFATPIAGGVASFAEVDSPMNKVAGLGFAGPPDPAGLDAVERAYAACGAPIQVEVANLADPAVGEMLTGGGYRLVSFENVLGRALDRADKRVTPPGIEVRRSGDDELEAWLDVVADAVAVADTQGIPTHEEFPRDVVVNAMRDMAAAGVRRYVGLRGGAFAGGGSMRLAEGLAQLTGAATAPAHRRHGVQTALLSARLADAAAAGCDIAVVTTQPGSKSQQNVQRQGFDLLYTRAVLVKHT